MVLMPKRKVRDIGYDIKPPEGICEGDLCPWHGKLPIRGKILEGTVVSARMQGTVVIRRDYLHFVPKYERHEKRKSRITAHLPSCIPVNRGDFVKIAECRPLSKTKHFVVIEKAG